MHSATIGEDRAASRPGPSWPLIDIFLDPRQAFAAIEARPRAALPVIAAGVMNTFLRFVFFAPSTQPLKMLATFLLEVVPLLLVILVAACALWGAKNLAAEAEVPFRTMFSLVAHVFFASTLLVGLLTLLCGVFAPEWVVNGAVPTSLAALLDSSTAPAVQRLVGAVDGVAAYRLFLLSWGVAAVGPVLSRYRAAAVVLTPWAAYTAAAVGIKLLFA
jgi:hypothetical protein